MSEVTYVVRCAETNKPLAGFFTPCDSKVTAFGYAKQLEGYGYPQSYVVARDLNTGVETEVFDTEVYNVC